MEIDKHVWRNKAIPLGQECLDAFVRVFDTNLECDAFLNREKRSVIAAGETIFYHVSKPPLETVQLPGGAVGVGFRYSSKPVPEIWYVARCSFEELLEGTRFFGFPSRTYVQEPDAAFESVKAFLLRLHGRKTLAITQIEDSHLMLEFVNSTDILDEQDTGEVINMNKRIFGVHESEAEEKDKTRNWIKRRFFTVGAI
jgi:hypothetical protein